MLDENEVKNQEVKENVEETNKENVEEEKKEIIAEEMVEEEPSSIVDVNEELHERINLSDENTFFNLVNTRQKKFMEYFNKTKKMSTLFMLICLAVIILVFFLAKESGAFIYICLGFVLVYFVLITLYSKKTKSKLNEDSNKVIEEYFINLDSYVTSNKAFSDVKFNQTKKLEENTFKDLKICKDIIQVTARDYIEGKLLSYNFVAGDNCVKTREKKENGSTQDYIVFLGKLFVLDAKLVNDEQRAIIYLKGKGSNGPTDIDDLTLQEEVLSEKYVVYSNFDVNTILNDEIKLVLEQFEVNDYLVDMFITINNSKLAFGFSYNDGIMVVPLTNPVGKNDIKEYKKDVELMVEIVEHLKKED